MTAKTLTLYGELSPNVRKVVILLEELGLDYELRHVAVLKGEQFTAKFRALNPFGKVPVLVDPELEVPVFESGAILFYLAERHGRFLPGQGAGRYEAMAWLIAQMANVGPMIGQLNHFRMLGDSEPYALGRYEALSDRLLRTLDERVASRRWMAGEDYSIADMAIYPWAAALGQQGFDPADYPSLVRWCEGVEERPAVQRSLARMLADMGESSNRVRKSATAAELDLYFGRTETMLKADYSVVTQ